MRRFGGGVDPVAPGTGCIKGVWGASWATAVHFGENVIKQKLQGAPYLVGGHLFGPQIQIQKDLGGYSQNFLNCFL